MPAAPKPSKHRKRKDGNPWLNEPTTPPPHREIVGGSYLDAKLESIRFWKQGINGLPWNVHSVCCVCGKWFTTPGDGPHAHHGIIPRNRGVTVNLWWNLFPACPHCHMNVLHSRQGMQSAKMRLYKKISKQILGDNPSRWVRGEAWIEEQIAKLEEEGHIDLRQKT